MNISARTFFPAVSVLCGAGLLAESQAQSPGIPAAHAPQSQQQVTFNRDVAPIIFHNCSMCHRTGEAGPFSLLTYADVKSRARQIVGVTQRRYMPPWLPEPNQLKFADELRLTDEQLTTIKKWVEQGAVEGDPGDLPARPQFTAGWQIGKPDLIVQAEKPFSLAAEGTDTYWNFIFRAPVNQTRWVRAVEIRPGDKRVVHHANILVDRVQSARRDEKEPGAGFAGMELKIVSESFDPDSHFLFWKPGTIARPEPDGMTLRLDKDTDLVLNIHLQPSGKPEAVQPSLGLYFTDKPATLHPMLLQLENDRMLDIPAGEKNFVVADEFTLPVAVDLLAIYPHAHYLGKDLLATATLPGGEKQTLIHIKRWDLNWQAVYTYEKAVALPAGTVISMRYTYDNSDDNDANPSHPPQRVVAGNRSSDEMAHLWLQVLAHAKPEDTSDPRMTLQEAMARHNVEKNPADFEAHYNLGAMLEARGAGGQAIHEFEAALGIRPDDPTVNNALGAALLAAGRLEESIPRFSAALKIRPDDFDAHYNLANALAGLDRFEPAIEHLRAAVRIRPDDLGAEVNLGSALAVSGNLAEAKKHFERALQLDPQNALARDNLAEVNRELANPR